MTTLNALARHAERLEANAPNKSVAVTAWYAAVAEAKGEDPKKLLSLKALILITPLLEEGKMRKVVENDINFLETYDLLLEQREEHSSLI